MPFCKPDGLGEFLQVSREQFSSGGFEVVLREVGSSPPFCCENKTERYALVRLHNFHSAENLMPHMLLVIMMFRNVGHYSALWDHRVINGLKFNHAHVERSFRR